MSMAPRRVALIGLGHIGRIHIAALQDTPGLELVAACDREAALVSVVPPSVSFFLSHQEMLRRGGLDVAIVATPNQTHNAIALDALRAGLDVIVEKPAASTMAGLDALEAAAREHGRHVYYAFHAATACEVRWLAAHLHTERQRYGALTAFLCRFYDPYIDAQGQLVPHAAGLEDCWSDSGVNALSVLDAVFPVDRFRVSSRRRSGGLGAQPGLLSCSVHFAFPVLGADCGGSGVIETAWDQGINHKCTELFFGMSGWRFVLDHSCQSVTAWSPDGEKRMLAEFAGDRMLNHYRGLFSEYCGRCERQEMNVVAARRIHAQLFSGREAE